MEAAFTAAAMCNGHTEAAQYLIHHAATAPPVCRLVLHDGCYSADCQFLHDLDARTCIFWLREGAFDPTTILVRGGPW
jgi:hypothetical protein